jgi:hypothetical protein
MPSFRGYNFTTQQPLEYLTKENLEKLHQDF